MATADQIRAALICPTCKQRGTIRAHRLTDAPGIVLRLVCDGESVESKRCGVLGDFEPPDQLAWSHATPEDAVRAIQKFLDAATVPEGAIDLLAFARQKDDRIATLEETIRTMARAVHHAYHGPQLEPDGCECDWTACPRAICRRAQRALGFEASGG